LQDYGVDKVFFLENENIDSSQKNVIFLIRGENAARPLAVAGMPALLNFADGYDYSLWSPYSQSLLLLPSSFYHFLSCGS